MPSSLIHSVRVHGYSKPTPGSKVWTGEKLAGKDGGLCILVLCKPHAHGMVSEVLKRAAGANLHFPSGVSVEQLYLHVVRRRRDQVVMHVHARAELVMFPIAICVKRHVRKTPSTGVESGSGAEIVGQELECDGCQDLKKSKT